MTPSLGPTFHWGRLRPPPSDGVTSSRWFPDDELRMAAENGKSAPLSRPLSWTHQTLESTQWPQM